MKIDNDDRGAPIWLSPRRNNGVQIIQGTSKILVSGEEVQRLIQGINEMCADATPKSKMEGTG